MPTRIVTSTTSPRRRWQPPDTPIQRKYRALGGESGFLGRVTQALGKRM